MGNELTVNSHIHNNLCFTDELEYHARIERMINRNSGIRGQTRTDEERQPKTEIITSRTRDDSCIDNDMISSLEKHGIEERLCDNAEQVEDLSLEELEEEVVSDIWYNIYKLYLISSIMPEEINFFIFVSCILFFYVKEGRTEERFSYCS